MTLTPSTTPLPTETPTPTETPAPTFTPSPTLTPTPTLVPVGTLLLYLSGADTPQLYLADLDYGLHTRLTDSSYGVSSPGWTPDGWHIVYAEKEEDTFQIYSIDWNGQNNSLISVDASQNQKYPFVSPDGSKIAFLSNSLSDWDLYTMEMDGSNVTAVTDDAFTPDLPSWSPDGKELLFGAWIAAESNMVIVRMSVDGQNSSILTDGSIKSTDPSWSPDGESVIFTCEIDGVKQICSMLPDGSDVKILTQSRGDSFMQVWSHDGSKIAFTSLRDSEDPDHCSGSDCNYDIYVMDADGRNQVRLTDHDAYDWNPSWSPDDSQIAFVTYRDEQEMLEDCQDRCNSEIYVMEANGDHLVRVTDSSEPDWGPLWRPPVTGEAPGSLEIPTSTPQAAINRDDGEVEQVIYSGCEWSI